MLDLETTGLSTTQDRIIEIGLVKRLSDGTVEEFSCLINPEMARPEEATKVHSITDEMVSIPSGSVTRAETSTVDSPSGAIVAGVM